MDRRQFCRTTAAADNYGPTYERLQKIKVKHDPSNLFRLNSNIEPVA